MPTRHCHSCGWEYTLPGLPGRTECCHQCGADLKVCLNCIHFAPRVAQQCKERGDEAWALHQLGVVHAHADPPDAEQAEAHYQEALTLADELGMRPLQAHCHRGLGLLYAATGQREQACTALSTAIEMYTSMDMTFWLPQTEAARAQVEGH